jgi:adenylylsulfate kinase
MQNNIYPTDKIISRAERERRNGLSGSGKTTLALKLERYLFEKNVQVVVLDGDNLRTGLCSGLGFSDEERLENIRRAAETAKLFLHAGFVVLAGFVSPTEKIRSLARNIIGADDYREVFVKASFETCRQRDVKGLYRKAAAGEVKNFTGMESAFEEPARPDLTLDTESRSEEECFEQLKKFVVYLFNK